MTPRRRALLQRLAGTAAVLACPVFVARAQAAMLPIELLPTGDLGALPTVRVQLAGQSVLAVVDTGATVHLVDPALASALSLSADGQVDVNLPGGRQRVPWRPLTGLRLGGAEAGPQRALSLDLAALRDATGADLRLLLGMPLWAARPTSIDLARRELRWGDAAPVGGRLFDWALQLDDGLATVAARFGTRLAGAWLLDTGNAGAAVVFARRAQGLDVASLPTLTAAEMGGEVSVRFARSALASVGPADDSYTRRDVPLALEVGRAARRGGHFDRLAGSLGTALFDGGTLWLDVAGRRAVLRHADDGAALPGGFGLVPQVQDGLLRLQQVLAQSPAALAGLQPGDRLVSVDGQPVASAPALWRAVRGLGSVALEVEREGRSRSLMLSRAPFFPALA